MVQHRQIEIHRFFNAKDNEYKKHLRFQKPNLEKKNQKNRVREATKKIKVRESIV